MLSSGSAYITKYLLVKEIRRLKSKILECFYPTRCVGCERLGYLLCNECQNELVFIDQSTSCTACGAPFGRNVCTECSTVYDKAIFPFAATSCALEFNELSRRLVLTYKNGGEKRLAVLLAQLLAQVIPRSWYRWADLITWIPADPIAYKRRGFDHMAYVADALSKRIGLSAKPLLYKRSIKDQRSLNRSDRQLNMREVFLVNKPKTGSSLNSKDIYFDEIRAKNIILIDDVFTTGATLSAATNVLLNAKANEVRVATICRVW